MPGTGSPVSITRRCSASAVSAMPGTTSRTVRPMCAAAGRPLISARRALMRV
jgi:hypothetical protein